MFICRAGRDAARAFATGCFATHRTHDVRGLSQRELKVRFSTRTIAYHFLILRTELGPLERVFR